MLFLEGKHTMTDKGLIGQFILLIAFAIIAIIVINLILDKIYDTYPILQKIVLFTLIGCSAAVFYSSYLTFIPLDFEKPLFVLAAIQFLYFYNLGTHISARSWTERWHEEKTEYEYVPNAYDPYYATITEKKTTRQWDEDHWRPGWWEKLIGCIIFTVAAFFLAYFLELYFFIALIVEGIIAYKK